LATLAVSSWHRRCCNISRQSCYIEVAQGAIFMEQNMRFGLILGRLSILKKKNWANYEQLLRLVFSCFRGQKNMLNFFLKHCSIRTKKLHNMSFIIFFFWFKKNGKYSQSIVYCSTRDTSLRDFYILTLYLGMTNACFSLPWPKVTLDNVVIE